MATVLVLLSLVLLTVYFRESPNGALHDVQGTAASVLKPFEVAAERIARPFQDAAGWFGDILGAKSENAKLRKQLEDYRLQVIQNRVDAQDLKQLKKTLGFRDSPRFPTDFRAVVTRVISREPTQFEQQVGIAAGTTSGIRVHDPVITPEGLVGQVTNVADDVAQVTLLTDETSAVSAIDSNTQAEGIVQHPVGRSEQTLFFGRVSKEQIVNRGDVVVTSGWRSSRFASIYPHGIPIGSVTYYGQKDTDLYKQVLVEPFVDFSSVQAVIVLVPKKRPLTGD